MNNARSAQTANACYVMPAATAATSIRSTSTTSTSGRSTSANI
jgi:hypothetical protein